MKEKFWWIFILMAKKLPFLPSVHPMTMRRAGKQNFIQVLPWANYSRVVLSEAVDWCICFTRKIQHGGDWERSRPQGLKNVHNCLMTVRPLSWACGHGAEMLLILKKLFSPWLFRNTSRYVVRKKCPTILYAVNLWLKPVSATGARQTSAALPGYLNS